MKNYEIQIELDSGHCLCVIIVAVSRKMAVDNVRMMLESLILQGRVDTSDMSVKQIWRVEEVPGAMSVNAASVL